MDQVNAMLAHWQEEPPADCLIASFLGYKPPSRAEKAMSEEENRALAARILASVPPPRATAGGRGLPDAE